ncbi:MAG: YybS family protein [Bacillota bacterium]
MKHRTQVRPLAQGALMSAITVLLALINMYIPFMGLLVVFVLPVPVVLMQLRYGMRYAFLAAVVSGALLLALAGPVEALLLFSFFGIIGLTFGYAFRRGFSPTWAVLTGTVAVSASWAISMGMTFLVLGLSPLDMLNQVYEAMTQAFDLYERWNLVSAEVRTQMLAAWDLIRDNVYHIMPATFAMSATVSSYVTYQVIRPVLARLGHRLEPFPAFAEWRVPSYFVFGLLAELTLAMTYPWHGSETLVAVGSNAGMFARMAFVVMGISLATYLLRKYGVPKLVSAMAIWMMVFTPLLLQVAMLAGMFDALFDYRRSRLGDRDR